MSSATAVPQRHLAQSDPESIEIAAQPQARSNSLVDGGGGMKNSVALQNDATILERIAAGDHQAVEACVDQYGSLVWTLAKRFCRSAADAEDASQEVFIELWEKASRFDRTRSSETTFISMIARRRLIDRMRREKYHLAAADVTEVEVPDSANVNNAEVADEAEKAQRCVRKLNSQQQKIIFLSVHKGASHSAIADTLRIPLGTVKSFARRALLQLRECMNRNSTSAATGGFS